MCKYVHKILIMVSTFWIITPNNRRWLYCSRWWRGRLSFKLSRTVKCIQMIHKVVTDLLLCFSCFQIFPFYLCFFFDFYLNFLYITSSSCNLKNIKVIKEISKYSPEFFHISAVLTIGLSTVMVQWELVETCT